MKDCLQKLANSANIKEFNKQCRKKTQNADKSTVKPFVCGNCEDSFEANELFESDFNLDNHRISF